MPPPETPLRTLAPAKINLWLHVTGRRPDCYHELDSLVAFADIGDILSIAPADDLRLAVSGPFAGALEAGADNLVLRAARALAAQCGVPAAAALHLEKRLPVAAGLGGGSADAAAALRLCALLWARQGRAEIGAETLAGLAPALGADVPACLAGTTARMSGIGDDLAPLRPAPPPVPAVLVNPGIPLSTGRVFGALDGPVSSPVPMPDEVPAGGRDFAALAQAGGNDLEAPAIALVPEIADALAALRAAPGLLLARMSGSGATCFGLFAGPAAAAEAARAIAAAHPAWWVAPCRIGGRPG